MSFFVDPCTSGTQKEKTISSTNEDQLYPAQSIYKGAQDLGDDLVINEANIAQENTQLSEEGKHEIILPE